jgi:hypothetical protein
MALTVEEALSGLNDTQKRIIDHLEIGEYVYPSSYIASSLSLPRNYVLKNLRWFKKHGLCNFSFLMAEDEYRLVGSGYWLTNLGAKVQAEIRRGMSREDWDDLI